ncbi:DUF3622 domain-containing protein [Shewanella sp. SR43-4]|jgi:hypothetical protein|uniref:DUF3622 domain-containing protein n=1 Tax=Shewanella vesiculosa TaxID=518738 RepID=A0ABV0FKC6_9GAMM|nr:MULTISPECIES: DUF3622 domain-containing protein [Shewanella]NCQ44127.1 DUF3622 domain-containing protein [Shewanella frigidimarina]MBB1317405.1 DUF3622 domain-containing protein [Shewanella sp. SR43-4]MBB1388397.1 DUF3622 domain-containing protein [Shewanella sp. SG44-6]NCO71054.1 DUF3622 domain-containing protein [Shewanella vesiculosa]NCP35088.1 DUF3622 domain-containing protein [Shewanella vesiculosa]|tara:strand:- start:1351 stop:1674 length:324 start_codon:yes stop_codon:yes gene_type:complete
MSDSKKYALRVIQIENTWKTEITRRMTATKTIVSKSQDGFATEAEAIAWGEQSLQGFLAKQADRNKRKTEKHLKAKSVAAAIAAESAIDEEELFDAEDDAEDDETFN